MDGDPLQKSATVQEDLIVHEDEQYDPIDYLETKQVQTVLRMVLFPGATKREIADAMGITPDTLRNWQKNEHFKALLKQKQTSVVDNTIKSFVARNANIYDRLTEEVLERLEQPPTSEDELAEALGNENFTVADRERYEKRFVKWMDPKDLLKIWGQFDDRVREDADRANMQEDDEQLVVRVRNRYSELLIRRKRMRQFREETGYDDTVNIHEDMGTQFIDAEFEPVGPHDKEVVEAEIVDPDEDDFLAAYSID